MPYIKKIKRKRKRKWFITVIHMTEIGDEFPMYF